VLKGLGYNVSVRVLFAAHYGVPQTRWRTIFIATRENIDPNVLFPIPTHLAKGRANFRTNLDGISLIYDDDFVERNSVSSFVTVNEAIGDLPPLDNKGGAFESIYMGAPSSEYQTFVRGEKEALYNHQCAGLGKANLQRLPYIPQGGSWRDIPHELLPAGMQRARRSDHTKRYGRLHPEGIASTILTKCDPHWGTYIHPNQERVLSVREAARLQSFPDASKFLGTLSEQYEQVGNAVPPLFAKAIGEQVLSVLQEYKQEGRISKTFWGKRAQPELDLVM